MRAKIELGTSSVEGLGVEPCMYWGVLKVWPWGWTRTCPTVGIRMVLLVKKNHWVVKYMCV